MERFSQRESLLLGYSPARALINSRSAASSSSNAPNRSNSDVDFHDVFGGPPRRSLVHEMRYSFSEVSETSALKKIDSDGDEDEDWSGFTEKPVFGEESVNRRRPQSDNFFDDIFRGNNSVTSSPRRLHLDPFSSTPGSRILSPSRSLPPIAEPSMASSLPAQLSLPTKLAKEVDLPTFGSPSHATSLSRFSNQAIQSPEDSKNNIRSNSHGSSLSRSFSHTGGMSTSDKEDTGGNLEQGSKSKESPTSSSPSQFHFSIYKWASKGVPMVLPLRGRSGSRVQKRTKNEEQSSTNECAADESEARKSPNSTLPNIGFLSNDHPLADARSPAMEPSKQGNDLILDESTADEVEVEPCQPDEEAILPEAESETVSSLLNTVKDVSGNTASCHTSEDTEHHPLLQTASCADPQKEIPALVEQIHKPDLQPIRSLLFDDDLQPGNDEIIKKGDRKESVVKGRKKPSVEVGANEIVKNQKGKRSSLTNAEVDKASSQGSPRNSRDNLGRSKVKGKVKDFVKMFNQEVLCKSPYDGDLGSQSSKVKEKGIFKSENEAGISTTRMHENLQKYNDGDLGSQSSKVKEKGIFKAENGAGIRTTRIQEDIQKFNNGDLGSHSSIVKKKGIFKAENEAGISTTRMHEDLQKSSVKNTVPDASIMVNEDLKQLEKENSEAKTANHILSSNPPRLDGSASSTGSVPNGSKAIIEDADESSQENFQIKELTEDTKKQPQAENNREELQAIDAKIRQWSRGKEGNIRSLLTTMQYVLWPESGWKTVPLVDIIEGNSVKRAYQRALLCLHPDKLQQKGAASHHKYIAAKVFDILQEAWDHFNSLGPL